MALVTTLGVVLCSATVRPSTVPAATATAGGRPGTAGSPLHPLSLRLAADGARPATAPSEAHRILPLSLKYQGAPFRARAVHTQRPSPQAYEMPSAIESVMFSPARSWTGDSVAALPSLTLTHSDSRAGGIPASTRTARPSVTPAAPQEIELALAAACARGDARQAARTDGGAGPSSDTSDSELDMRESSRRQSHGTHSQRSSPISPVPLFAADKLARRGSFFGAFHGSDEPAQPQRHADSDSHVARQEFLRGCVDLWIPPCPLLLHTACARDTASNRHRRSGAYETYGLYLKEFGVTDREAVVLGASLQKASSCPVLNVANNALSPVGVEVRPRRVLGRKP